MALYTVSDRVDTLEASEKYGAVVHLVRKFRVLNIVATDFTVLQQALAASGVPAAGSRASGFPNLVATERKASLIEGDPASVDVEVTYEHGDNEGQNLDSPPFGLVVGEVSSYLNQIKSNTDADGNRVTVSYTYPAKDPVFPAGTIKETSPTFDFHSPQRTLKYKGVKITPFPWLLAMALNGNVNANSWSGGAARTWMCMNVGWHPCDAGSPNRYFFTFEFQYNPQTWDPEVAYKDPTTGEQPFDLVDGVGRKVVLKQTAVDFEAVLGVRVQGG